MVTGWWRWSLPGSCCVTVVELNGPNFGPVRPMALKKRVAAAAYVLQRGSGLCGPYLGPAGCSAWCVPVASGRHPPLAVEGVLQVVVLLPPSDSS